jgi:hypothetical protein
MFLIFMGTILRLPEKWVESSIDAYYIRTVGIYRESR